MQFTLLLCIILHGTIKAFAQQVLLNEHKNNYKDKDNSFDDNLPRSSIAIIGAGISGASLAHTLGIRTDQHLTDINLFERDDRVGGRIQTLQHDRPWKIYETVERGGAKFSPVDDTCLMRIVEAFNLPLQDYESRLPINVTKTTCDVDTDSWKRRLQYVWRYGLSGLRMREYVKVLRSRWQGFFDQGFEKDLQNVVTRAGITSDLLLPADIWLQGNISDRTFEQVILQPCTQIRQGRDLQSTTAWSTLLAARDSPRKSVKGGNVLMVERSLQASASKIRLNTTVLKVETGSQRRYRITYTDSAQTSTQQDEYDFVVLAAPHYSSDIIINVNGAEDVPHVEYQSQYTTFFTSLLPMSTKLNENLLCIRPDGRCVPLLNDSQIDTFSPNVMSWLDCLPDPMCDSFSEEYLYQITSKHQLSRKDLSDLLDHGQSHDLLDDGITWQHDAYWKTAYPVLSRVDNITIPKSVELAPGLYYTAGLEIVGSSMELSCRMGRYVGQSILRELGGLA